MPFNCNKFSKPSIPAICTKAYSARLHRWQFDGNFCLFDHIGYTPAPESNNFYCSTIWQYYIADMMKR